MTIEHDRLLVGGRWVPPSGEGVLTVRSPATGELVGRVPRASAADVDAAVGAARRAFDEGPWPQMSMKERAEVLGTLGGALRPFADELDHTVPVESGIPVCFRPGSSGLAVVDSYAELGQTFVVEEHRPGRPQMGSAVVRHCPAGVVAAIVPWNGPVMQILMKLAPALLAGCSVVVKTAPETPLSSYRVAEAVVAAGIPDGVVSILPGDRDAGTALVRHRGVDRVSFTGGTATGARIAAECGRDLRRVSLELGGKSAAVLLEDVDLDAGLGAAITCGLFYNGEACSALTRMLVPRALYTEVVDRTVAHVETLAVGDPLDPGTFVGPLVSERQRDTVEEYVALGVAEGARLVTGGDRPGGTGWYVRPAVFADVDNSMRIAREEVFGPLLCLIAYDGIDHAVALANDSDLGLAGGVFTADPEAGMAVARRLRTGHVGVNCQGQDWVFPFGGFKRSGFGREMGVEGLTLYTELQTIGLPEAVEPLRSPAAGRAGGR